MPKLAAHGTRIYLDNFAAHGYLNSSEQNVMQELAKTDSFGDNGPRRVVGNYDYEDAEVGFFDGDDDLIDEVLHGLIGSAADHYLTKLWGASAEGGIAYDKAVMLEGKPLSAQLAGAVMLNLNTKGSNGMSRGHILGNVTVASAGNRSGVNQGAKASGALYRVIFRLLAFSGTNITLKLQESQNDGSPDAYADVSGLTSGALTATGIVVATTTAAMEAWRRLNIGGTFTSATVLVTGGVVAGT